MYSSIWIYICIWNFASSTRIWSSIRGAMKYHCTPPPSLGSSHMFTSQFQTSYSQQNICLLAKWWWSTDKAIEAKLNSRPSGGRGNESSLITLMTNTNNKLSSRDPLNLIAGIDKRVFCLKDRTLFAKKIAPHLYSHITFWPSWAFPGMYTNGSKRLIKRVLNLVIFRHIKGRATFHNQTRTQYWVINGRMQSPDTFWAHLEPPGSTWDNLHCVILYPVKWYR